MYTLENQWYEYIYIYVRGKGRYKPISTIFDQKYRKASSTYLDIIFDESKKLISVVQFMNGPICVKFKNPPRIAIDFSIKQ